MILNDFDEIKTSTFDPYEVENIIPDFPKIGISCFSYKIIEKLVNLFNGKQITYLSNTNGKVPVYKITYNNYEYVLFMSNVGASACVVQYEEVFVMGVETIVTFGTCGVLDRNIDSLAIIIPNCAVRDEGTSYHYMKLSDEVLVNEKYKDIFKDLLKEHNYSFVEGKVWTTDAPYRETKNKVIKRKENGCICVDMECSALGALAKFRNKEIFQFFYAADNLDGSKWDARSLGNDDLLEEKEKIGLLAIEMANKINEVKMRK